VLEVRGFLDGEGGLVACGSRFVGPGDGGEGVAQGGVAVGLDDGGGAVRARVPGKERTEAGAGLVPRGGRSCGAEGSWCVAGHVWCHPALR
jgi:hypothetical protein